MAITREVKFKIIGSVPGDYNDNDYKVVIAKLELICAEHELELITSYF